MSSAASLTHSLTHSLTQYSLTHSLTHSFIHVLTRSLIVMLCCAVLCSEYGLAQGGLPVVFLHGNLNSRLLAPAWAHSQELTAGAGCRVLALDRPGE